MTPAAPSTNIGKPRSHRKYAPIAITSPSVPRPAHNTLRAAEGNSGRAPLPPEKGVRRVIRSSPEVKSSYSFSRLTAAWASTAPTNTSRVSSSAGEWPCCHAVTTPSPTHKGARTRKLGREARTTAIVSDIHQVSGMRRSLHVARSEHQAQDNGHYHQTAKVAQQHQRRHFMGLLLILFRDHVIEYRRGQGGKHPQAGHLQARQVEQGNHRPGQ